MPSSTPPSSGTSISYPVGANTASGPPAGGGEPVPADSAAASARRASSTSRRQVPGPAVSSKGPGAVRPGAR